MGALRGIWVGALVLAACAAGGAILLAHGGGTSSVAPPASPAVTASLDRTSVEFGDPVTAQVTVLADRRRAGADHVVVKQDLAPLTQLGRTRVTHATRGNTRLATYTTRASCMDESCTGNARSRRIVLRPVIVEIGGGTPRTVPWPALVVHTRVSAADVAKTKPPMRSDATAPPVSYRVAPGRLALVLEIAGAVLAAAAVLVAAWAGAGVYRHRRHAARPTGLERALALAREAESRPPPDRRRALGLLADALGSRNDRLAEAADELAWSAPAPTTDALTELVTEVEHEVNGGER